MKMPSLLQQSILFIYVQNPYSPVPSRTSQHPHQSVKNCLFPTPSQSQQVEFKRRRRNKLDRTNLWLPNLCGRFRVNKLTYLWCISNNEGSKHVCTYVDSRSFFGIWNPSASPLIVNHVTGRVGFTASSTWLVSQKVFFMRRIGWWELQQICYQSSYFAFGVASKPSLMYTIYTLFLLELGRYSLWVSSLNMYGKERKKKGRVDGLPPGKKKGKKKNIYSVMNLPHLYLSLPSHTPLPIQSPCLSPPQEASPPPQSSLPPRWQHRYPRNLSVSIPAIDNSICPN